ncbi:MAG TPA: hypothetical protein VG965_04430 [Patescibacteria group bacterium]|nr:hypothetical protein [Patescibacteria group bacterium]
MEKFITKRMVVKIGTSSITESDGAVNIAVMQSIANQVSTLIKHGVEVAIVSSGAVNHGRCLVKHAANKKTLSIFGQSSMMGYWISAFKKHKILVGQVLVSDTLQPNIPIPDALSHGVAIVNGNDVVINENSEAANNDRVAMFVLKTICADTLVSLTDVDGVYDNQKQIIEKLSLAGLNKIEFKNTGTGTGGMKTKVLSGFEALEFGARSIIAKADKKNVLLKVAKGLSIGTELVNN